MPSKKDVLEIRNQSKHYHSEAKGCKIEPKKLTYKKGNRVFSIIGGYCKTHRKKICRCGWEVGHHFDVKS